MKGGYVCYHHGGNAPQTKRKAQERLADLIDPKRILRELTRIAYIDISGAYDDAGLLLPLSTWPDDLRKVVKSIETVNKPGADGVNGGALRVQWLGDAKLGAIQTLMKHLGIAGIDKTSVEVSVDNELIQRLQSARARMAMPDPNVVESPSVTVVEDQHATSPSVGAEMVDVQESIDLADP